MEAQSVCQLIPIKEEIFESLSDINLEVIKKEPIDDIVEDDLMHSVDFDESELTVSKRIRTYGKISSASDHQLFPIKNEFMDPLYINPELIKREHIDDDSFSIGNYIIPINTISAQPNENMTEKSKSRELSKMGANVPTNSKYNLKRNARRLNGKNDKANRKSTNNRTRRLALVDGGHGIPFSQRNDEQEALCTSGACLNEAPPAYHFTAFSKIKEVAGEYFPRGYNAESTNYNMEQWTITEVAEAPVSNFNSRRDRKRIEDDDYFPTKKERLARDKLVNGSRPRGRPRKSFDVGTDGKQTQEKNVKSQRKSSDKIQSVENHSPNQTSDVERMKAKVEFESEVITDDLGDDESTISC